MHSLVVVYFAVLAPLAPLLIGRAMWVADRRGGQGRLFFAATYLVTAVLWPAALPAAAALKAADRIAPKCAARFDAFLTRKHQEIERETRRR